MSSSLSVNFWSDVKESSSFSSLFSTPIPTPDPSAPLSSKQQIALDIASQVLKAVLGNPSLHVLSGLKCIYAESVYVDLYEERYQRLVEADILTSSSETSSPLSLSSSPPPEIAQYAKEVAVLLPTSHNNVWIKNYLEFLVVNIVQEVDQIGATFQAFHHTIEQNHEEL